MVEFNVEVNSTSFRFDASVTAAYIIFLMTPLGVIGNSLVLVAVLFSKKLRTKTNAFVACLAATDLLNCCFFPFQALALLSRDGRPKIGFFCEATGFVGTTTVIASVNILTLIGVNRWTRITRPESTYNRWYTRRTITWMLILGWGQPLLLTIIPHIADIAHLGYSEFFNLCSFTDNRLGEIYIAFATAVPMVSGFFIVVYTYGVIVWKICKRNRQVVPIGARELNVTQSLATVVGVFFVCVMTFVVCSMIPIRSKVLFLCGALMILGNSIINPFIYAYQDSVFKRTFKGIVLCRLRSIPEPSRELRFILQRLREE